jgi:hypothetical protein
MHIGYTPRKLRSLKSKPTRGIEENGEQRGFSKFELLTIAGAKSYRFSDRQ